MVDAMSEVLPAYEINSVLRLAHFLAQAAHETDGFRTLREYWGPTKAQKGYEGRKDLGNVKRGDGKRYMGRGIFQLTGRANYRTIGEKLTLPLEDEPELAAQPRYAVVIAAEFWESHGLNAKADADDLRGITRKINGGLNGLPDRERYLARAKEALGASLGALTVAGVSEVPKPEEASGGPVTAAPEPDPDPILTPTSPAAFITALQEALKAKNYDPGRADGKWGKLTSMAVMAAQKEAKLPINGDAMRLSEAKAAPEFVIPTRATATMADLRASQDDLGDHTIRNTDIVKAGGTITGGAVVAQQTGLLIWLQDHIPLFKELVDPIKELGPFIMEHAGWFIGGAAAIAVYFGWTTARKRLREYREAKTG